jgi:hypothetical protein
MCSFNREWIVPDHKPIEKFDDRVWRVEAPIEGKPLSRVMTIARRADDRLVLHSVIPLGDEAMAEIEAWGEPAFLVVPNAYHRLDAPAYKERYPHMEVLCPPGAVDAVGKAVEVDGVYEEFSDDEHVRLETLAGVDLAEGVMRVDGDGTTLVFNDAIFNMPHVGGFQGFMLRYLTASSGGPRISRLTRWLLVDEASALAEELERYAEIEDLRRIIVSHHEVIDEDPSQVLRELADSL